VKKFLFRDINSASECFASVYGKGEDLDYFGSPGLFSISVMTARLGSLILAKARARGHSMTRAGDGWVHITVPIAGTPFHWRRGAQRFEAVAGESAGVKRWSEAAQVTVVDGVSLSIHAPVRLLTGHAERLALGSLTVSPDSQIADLVTLRTPAGRALARTLKTAVEEIEALDSLGLAPLVAAGYEDLLLSVVAATLFPAITASLGRPSAHVAPAVIRRARDHIRENAAEPLEVSKLAQTLGIPIRTLQDNFRRHFGLSPQAWIRECRLERARQSLALPDGATSVSAVAQESGFGNLGDFSVQYRKKYGEAPSETLRLARRRFG
jgi:AraC-like DNA-binding protein